MSLRGHQFFEGFDRRQLNEVKKHYNGERRKAEKTLGAQDRDIANERRRYERKDNQWRQKYEQLSPDDQDGDSGKEIIKQWIKSLDKIGDEIDKMLRSRELLQGDLDEILSKLAEIEGRLSDL